MKFKINNINSCYNKCYYINLDKSLKRKKYMEHTLRKFNIISERISAVEGNLIKEELKNPYNRSDKHWNKNALGLIRSFKKIIIDAKNKNYETILILEDDVVFEKNFNSRLNYYFKQLPEGWGVAQLSVGNFMENYKINRSNNNVFQVDGSYGTFGMLIHKRYYNLIFDIIDKENDALDNLFISIQKEHKKSYCFYPGLLKPLDGIESIITGEITYYSKYYNYIYPPQINKLINDKFVK